MKNILCLLILSPVIAMANSIGNAAESYVDTASYLEIACHGDTSETAFEILTSSDSLSGVRQINKGKFGATYKEAVLQDGVDITQVTAEVGLASLKKNNIEFFLRYANGLMWDSFIRVELRKSGSVWKVKIKIDGDEGRYFNKNDVFQCRIKGYNQLFEQTEKFSENLIKSL